MFELQQLGKLNLLVGTNNSGKTSILEAVQLLNSQSNFESLREVMIGRGEYILSDERGGGRELDVRHLFYGHEIDEGSKFSIFGNNHNDGEGITVSVEHTGQSSLFEDLQEFVLVIEWLGQENESIKLRFGIWIMPDNKMRGMLETFLTYMIPTDSATLWQFAQAVTNEAKGKGAVFTDPHLDKANIYTWLAWQNPPGRQLHQAIMERILHPNHPNARRFVTWFKALYGLI